MHFRIATLAGVIFMALVFTLSAQHAYAQGSGGFNCDTAPCGGDSTQWPWTYPQPFVIPLEINGCQYNNPSTCCMLTCKYRYRRSCFPAAYQLELLEIRWDRECAPTFDPVPMIKAITYGLLITNPMNFEPRTTDSIGPQCNSNYSVQAATCWRDYPDMKKALNCALDGSQGYACCKGGYQVCRKRNQFGQWYREVTWLGQSTVANNCGTDPNDPTHPCKPSCGAFNEDGIINRKKDDDPTLSMAPGSTDTVSVSTTPATIEHTTTIAPQRR
jgi:hypothetical protein